MNIKKFIKAGRILLPVLLFTAGSAFTSKAERIKPGFSKEEYIQLMGICARQLDTPWTNIRVPVAETDQMLYRSPERGLANRWDLWKHKDSTLVISIRGTVPKSESWLENFYSGMVKANGSIQLSKEQTFQYRLSLDDRALVHVGWLMALGFIWQDLESQLNNYTRSGYRDLIILGHSQGGAIANLLSAFLKMKQKEGGLSPLIQIKTYCSAAPKTGNTYYAYSYEALHFGGWAFNVVNAADWVPETPFSVQTLDDLNVTNPFARADETIRKQKIATRIAMNRAYRRMKNPSQKTMRRFRKYLGEFAGKLVRKRLPEYENPDYAYSVHYVRAGTHIALVPDTAYYQKFPLEHSNLFLHHMLEPYILLVKALPDEPTFPKP
jgi:hypothetical protein